MAKKTTIFTLVLYLLLPSILLSQVQYKEANNWALFNLSELDFNVGSPPAVSHNTQMNGGDGEGSSTISDKDGNLLFYTDGFDVWDRTHNVMPNGTGLNGGASRTSTNSGVIVPKPGSNTEYYIFIVGPFANPVFEYTLVDMSLNGGMGDVVIAQKNQQLFNFSTEKITATKHANGRDIWVICHEGGTANYRSYLVTPGGINPVPVATNIGTVHGAASDGVRGAMKVSSKGGKLVACIGGPGRVEIFDFDRATGVIANAMLFNDTDFPLSLPAGGSTGIPYGVEFSPDETKLYIAQMGSNTMIQVDVSVWDRDSIINSTVNVRSHYPSLQGCGLLQLGPDKKIYVAQYGNRYLGVINNPNQTAVGNAFGFDHQGVDLGAGYNAKYGLPVFIQSYFDDPSITFDGTCPGDTTNFYYTQGSFVDSIVWHFDDPTSGTNNYANTDTAKHFYSLEGTYNVQLVIYNGGVNDTLFAIVEITYPPVTINNGNDTVFCGDSLILTANNNDAISYLWSNGDTIQTATVNSSGMYYVTITNQENCQNTDTINVTFFPSASLNITPTGAGCVENGGSADLTIIGGTPGFSYLWSNGAITQDINGLNGGDYSVVVTDTNGCEFMDTVSVTQEVLITTSLNLTDPSPCSANNGSIDLTVTGGGTLSETVIYSEDFETEGHGSRYTANPYPGPTSGSYFFKRGDDASFGFTSDPTGESGSFYFGGRWQGFSSNPNTATVTLNPVNITNYFNIRVCLLAAVAYASGYETNDFLMIETRIDGGSWTPVGGFYGDGTNLKEDTDNNGTGDGASLSTSFSDFCFNVPATGTSMEIRITMESNAANESSLEQIAFDNIRIMGTLPLTYSYLWSTGDTTEDVSGLVADTYVVTVTGQNGCVKKDSITSSCIATTLVASFAPSDTSICVGDCITFTDNSTGTNINDWTWNFPSGTPTSATGQNPGSICYNSPGTFNMTLQVTDDNGTDDTTITVRVTGIEDATFNYSGGSYCQADPDPTPTIAGTSGGTFTSTPAGLSITAGTGVIDLSASTPGTYGVLYTTPSGTCPDTLTVFVTVTTSEDATFNYSAGSYCQNGADPTPTITGTSGGTFTSSPAGLSITAGTGVIDLSASTPGTYGVLYTTPSASCEDTLTVFVTVTAIEDATFNYSVGSYCQTEPDPTPTIAGTSGGMFTSIPAGLSITAGTGVIDLSASTPGTYGVLYTTPGTCSDTLTVFVTVTSSEDATFNYSAGSYCQNGTDPTPNIVGTSGGTFTSSPAGLSITAGTGVIDLSVSTPGTYGVLYTTPSASCEDTLTVFVTIEATEDATFNYSSASYCQDDVDPTPTIAGTSGGIFTSSPAGLSITAGTGVIDLSASTVGTYGVLYTTPGSACSDTLTVFVTIETAEDATFNYSSTTYCQNGADPTPTIAGTSGGIFTSSPAGLNITAGTGVIDLSASTPGRYGILYTTSGLACSDTLTVFVTINAADNPTFNYTGTIFCVNDLNPTVTITGTPSGIFSINNGGTVNTSTGELDLTASGAGSYTITYTTAGTCPASMPVVITITDQLDATITPIGPYCEVDASVTLVAVDAGGTWSGTGMAGATFSPSMAGIGTHEIIYSVGTGSCGDMDTIDIVVNSNPVTELMVVDDNCFNEEGSVSSTTTGGTSPFSYSWDSGEQTADISDLPEGIYTLIVTDAEGCKATSVATVEDLQNNCDYHIFLPNIFSPNGDGNNDVFLIQGKGIKSVSLIIYSRWGEKVFETNDKDIGWDGSFKGQEMNSAVFVYYLQATMVSDETIEKKGNVALVR